MNQSSNPDFARINGAEIYYETQGSGSPLLFIHAGVADSRMFDDQFDLFAQTFRVVRFDLRGFGRSDMPPGTFANHEDVRALLDFLGIKKTTILGISFGGLIALDFTLAYPDYVQALILGAPSISGAAPSDRIRQFWDDEEAALEAGDIAGATELNLRLWVDGPHRRPDQVEPRVREKVREMQTAAFLKEIPDDAHSTPLDPPAIDRLGEITIPLLVLTGDLDLEEKQATANTLAANIPGSRQVTLPGVAHMLNMEKPAQFNRQVLDFLTPL